MQLYLSKDFVIDYVNIILQNLTKANGTGACVLFLNGLVLSVTFNFVTIKMSRIIPMPIYLVFPVAATILLTMMQIMVPMLVKVYSEGEEVVEKWKYYTKYSKDVKYLTRRIAARQTLRVKVGWFGYGFFFVQKSTKVTYYEAVLTNTISTLMSVNVNKHLCSGCY